MSTPVKTYTLTGLQTALENFISENFSSKRFWITAEVRKSNEKGGHRYYELSDSKDGKETARASANLWYSTFEELKTRIPELEKILSEGNKVLIQVRIDYHKLFGLKLCVLDLNPAYTFGDIELRKQQTILRLKQEGIFDNQKKVSLGRINKRIGLVGSPNTSGYRDFVNEMTTNNIFTKFRFKEIHTSVQGDKAKAEMISALKEIDRYNVDVVVIIRGGGNKMDLDIFNDYDLCKTICLMKHPVITGIGHETDEVIADLVSKKRCITPSAAAKSLYNEVGIFRAELTTALDSVIKRTQQLLSGRKDEFQHVSKYLVLHTKTILFDNQKTLDNALYLVKTGFEKTLREEHFQLDKVLIDLKNSSIKYIKSSLLPELEAQLQRADFSCKNSIQASKLELNHLFEQRLPLLMRNAIEVNRIELHHLNDKLEFVNPIKLLDVGYTISSVEGVDLNQHDDNMIGKEMTTLSNKRIIKSTIKSIKNQTT